MNLYRIQTVHLYLQADIEGMIHFPKAVLCPGADARRTKTKVESRVDRLAT